MKINELEEWVLGMPADPEMRLSLERGLGHPMLPAPEAALRIKCHACGMEILIGPLCTQAIEQGGKPACLFCVLRRRVREPITMIHLDEGKEKSNAN